MDMSRHQTAMSFACSCLVGIFLALLGTYIYLPLWLATHRAVTPQSRLLQTVPLAYKSTIHYVTKEEFAGVSLVSYSLIGAVAILILTLIADPAKERLEPNPKVRAYKSWLESQGDFHPLVFSSTVALSVILIWTWGPAIAAFALAKGILSAP
jgi:hypothetical protein